MKRFWPFRCRAPAWKPRLKCILVAAALWASPGCDEDDTESSPPQIRAEELSRQIEAERRTHQRDLDLANTQLDQTQQDAEAVNSVLISCAVTIVILVILLARERRCRRLVERLLRMVLDRLHGPRIPP